MKWSTPYRGVSHLTVNEWTATVDAAKKYAEERIEWFVRTDTARHYED